MERGVKSTFPVAASWSGLQLWQWGSGKHKFMWALNHKWAFSCQCLIQVCRHWRIWKCIVRRRPRTISRHQRHRTGHDGPLSRCCVACIARLLGWTSTDWFKHHFQGVQLMDWELWWALWTCFLQLLLRSESDDRQWNYSGNSAELQHTWHWQWAYRRVHPGTIVS